MNISSYDAWALRRVVSCCPINGELDAMSEPLKAMAEHLTALQGNERQVAYKAMMAIHPDRDELVKAMADVDPNGPPPPAQAASQAVAFATLADVAKIVSSQPWLWKGWVALGVLNAVAADPGTGKTRFAMDLARRLWLGLPWPDGQPATYPAGTRTLWIQGDRNFA